MAMMYGDIDKSKQRRDDLDRIITNLTTVLVFLEASDDVYEKSAVEQFVKESLEIAQKLKGDS